MAKSRQIHRPVGKRRTVRRVLLAGALVALAALAWFWSALDVRATAAAAYGARVACSCRYLAARPLDHCRKDFMPGMGILMLSEDAEAKSVTATFPLVASQTATWRNGPGCVLEPWSD